MTGMVSRPGLGRSLPLALIVAASAVGAGCSADRAAALTTTAIVRLPTGFHVARPTDGVKSPWARAARSGTTTSELVTLRLETAHRRAAASIALDPEPATGGFVCQIDMGTAPPD